MADIEEERIVSTIKFTIVATAMPTIHVSRLRRLWLKLRRKPLPRAPQPPGTVPVMFASLDGRRRMYIPAARIESSDG